MIVYILMILISLSLVIIAEKVEKKPIKVFLYIVAVVPFFLVSALRFDLGTDYTKRYVTDYNKLFNGTDVKNLEIGFKWMVVMCTKITQDPTIIFVITTGIVLLFSMLTIFMKSKKIPLSILLFFLGGVFFNSLNLVRQYVAISLIFFGYTFICKEKNKVWEYLVFIFLNSIAVLFHSTSVVGFVLLFLNKKMLTNWKWVIPCCVVILLLNQRLMNIVALIIQNTRFSRYLSGTMSGADLSILQLIVNIMVYCYMSYVYYKNKKINNVKKEMIFYINVQAVTLIMIALSSVHIQFSRIALYFSIFQVISIPYFICNMPGKEIIDDFKKVLRNKVSFEKIIPKFELIVTAAWIILFIGLFGCTNIKNNDNEVVPYKTIINREWKIK